jgi:hypothetical protein
MLFCPSLPVVSPCGRVGPWNLFSDGNKEAGQCYLELAEGGYALAQYNAAARMREEGFSFKKLIRLRGGIFFRNIADF